MPELYRQLELSFQHRSWTLYGEVVKRGQVRYVCEVEGEEFCCSDSLEGMLQQAVAKISGG